jgi:hypothetical protein
MDRYMCRVTSTTVRSLCVTKATPGTPYRNWAPLLLAHTGTLIGGQRPIGRAAVRCDTPPCQFCWGRPLTPTQRFFVRKGLSQYVVGAKVPYLPFGYRTRHCWHHAMGLVLIEVKLLLNHSYSGQELTKVLLTIFCW